MAVVKGSFVDHVSRAPAAAIRRLAGRHGLAYLFILPSIVLVVAATVYPILYAFRFTLYRSEMLTRTEFVGADNYVALVRDSALRNNLLASAAFVFGSIALSLLLGLGLALLLNQHLAFRNVARAVIFIPWVTSMIASALIWRWLLNPGYGPLVYAMTRLGLPEVDPLGDRHLAMVVLVVANVWRSVAFSMILILAALQTIPENLYRAAAIDGASGWRTFRRVTLPLITPTLLVAIIILTMSYFNLIDMPLVLTGGGPLNATETVSLRLYREAFSYYRVGYASAIAILMLLVNVLLTLAYIRVLKRETLY